MEYSFEKLQTAEQCDLLLELAEKEKRDLEFRKMAIQRNHDSFEENSEEVELELQKVTAELATAESVIAGLPDGPRKEKEITEKIRLEYRKRVLTSRQGNSGVHALLMKELDQARIEKELLETVAFINSVIAHKATL